MKARISIIAATARKDRAIGRKNGLLWNIPADLRHFKKVTYGHPIIMGQKTFQSIGRPLPGRLNIVLTRDKKLKIDGCKIVHTIKEAVDAAIVQNTGEIFFIGGGQIFEQAIEFVDRLYLTLVEGSYKADVFFPDYSKFKKIISREKAQDERYKFEYIVLEK